MSPSQTLRTGLRRTWSWCSALLLTAASGAAAFAADEPATPAAATQSTPAASQVGETQAPGWRKLFDGKTLKNWQPTDFGGQGAVLVEEGSMILEPGSPLTGATWKGEALPKVNYELRMEAKKIEGGDFFLALTFPCRDSHCSLVLGGWGGGVVGLSSINGFDASENETTDYLSFEPGKWYKVRVMVTDKAIDAWLDDERIVNVETEGKRIGLRIEVDQNRPLGMATFHTKAAYRNIEIRELPAGGAGEPATPKPE